MTAPVLRTAAILGLFVPLAPAHAQLFGNPLLQSEIPSDYDLGRNTSVLDRPRPEYEARGVPVGPVTVRPRVGGAIGFTSNVNGTNAQRRADAFVTLSPQLTIETDALNDGIVLGGGADLQRYVRTPSRNQDSYFLTASAHQKVGRDTNVSAAADVRRFYEQNISTGVPSDAVEPVPIDFLRGNLRVQRVVGRWQLTGMGEARRLNYGDVRTKGGGIADQDFRDRDELLLGGRISYAATPETSAFVEVSGTRFNYSRQSSNGTLSRDAGQLLILGGVNLDIGALIRGRLGVGYVQRNYDAAFYRDLHGPVVDARLQFFPSKITTVTLSARRLSGESTISTSPGYFGSGVRLEADHELRRNLLLNASLDYERDRYLQSTRRDAAFTASGGARYFVSRTLGFGAQASYLRRRSNGEFSVPEFDEGRLLFTIVVQR